MIMVNFVDRSEIRMGSPFNLCRLRLSGPWAPDLPETDWQDIQAWREDGNAVALVRWDTPGNVPGFKIWVLDGEARTIWTSKRFPGCCEEMTWTEADLIAWRAFYDLEGVCRVGAGEPCPEGPETGSGG